jgi:hypothetical protein
MNNNILFSYVYKFTCKGHVLGIYIFEFPIRVLGLL